MERRVGSTSRREALASRRAARESASTSSNGNGTHRSPDATRTISIHESNDDSNWRQSKRVPIQNNLLASLSQALSNIDAMNNGHEYENTAGGAAGSSMGRGEEKRYRKIITNPPQSISGYLSFTRGIIRLLMGFTLCYLAVFICCLPMLSSQNNNTNGKSTMGDAELKRGESFQNIRGRKAFLKVKDQLGTIKERAIEWERQAKESALDELEDVLESSTVGRRDGEDALKAERLLEDAIVEFDKESGVEDLMLKKEKGHDHWEEALKSWEALPEGMEQVSVRNDAESNAEIYRGLHGNQKPGFIVLGMHRSGTSMLSGLLVKGFGYETGGPLIGAAFDNEKGFYERIDIVLQNDEFFSAQKMGWSFNVYNYNSEKALQQKQQGTITFNEGKKGLRFLNNPHKELPYLQKDPRMCITLPTWLELMEQTPAVVFTYRHPLEVAMSLQKREQGFTLTHGLRLWIVYNMRALQNSAKLCRVFSTNEAVVKNPLVEVQRIADELTTKCNVIPPPVTTLPKSVVDEFVDPKLQHNKEKPGGDEIKPGCIVPIYKSQYEKGSDKYNEEKEVFLMAMEIFCDLESGDALDAKYGWPDLETMKWPSSRVH